MIDMFVMVALHFGLKALSMLTSSMHGCDHPIDLASFRATFQSKNHVCMLAFMISFEPRGCALLCLHLSLGAYTPLESF